MHKKIIVMILVLFISIFIIGCNQEESNADINDYGISYLEVLEDRYLVDNEVYIRVTEKNADNILLNVREYGQEEIEKTIKGEKGGAEWEFVYSNNNPFTKEIWLTYFYEGKEQESEKKIITNQTLGYENAFENIVPIDGEEGFHLIKQKIDLDILGWMDKDKILARDNATLFIYDIHKNEKEILYENVFNVYPSPSFKHVIYQNNEGIYFSDIQKNDEKIYEVKEEAFLKDITWSNTEKVVLLQIIENDKNRFYFIDLNNGKADEFLFDEGTYALEEFIGIDNENLYALGHIINENSEVDAPSALLRINRRTGSIKNLTPDLQPMDEINILSQVDIGEFLVRITTRTIAEDDISSLNHIYLLDTQRGSLKNIRKAIESPYVYSLSPNKDDYIYLRNQDSESNQDEKIIIFGENKRKEVEFLKSIQHFPSKFYWSQDGNQILFYLDHTKEIYLIEKS